MKKLKQLWQYAVFRWCVYLAPLLLFGILASIGVFDTSVWRYANPWHFGGEELDEYSELIWFLIFALPTVWVWRKPIWSGIKLLIGSLNNLAEVTDTTNWNYQKAVVVLLVLIAFFTGWIAFNLELVTYTYDRGYGAETRIKVWN